MSVEKTKLVNEALAALMEFPEDGNYAKGVSALFQLANILGDKWLNELNIEPKPGEFFYPDEVLKRKNENINNVFQMKTSADILRSEIISSAIFPSRLNQINKTIYHAFFMGMAFGYLRPDFVLQHNLIFKAEENKAIRKKVQAETTEKITAWHPVAEAAYREVRTNLPHLKSALRIRDVIMKRYTIPGMLPRALYDLVLQWQKEADKKEPAT